MKYQFIGFNKEIEPLIRPSIEFKKMFVDQPYTTYQRQSVIKYLESGIFLTGAMSFIYDDERKSIGNLDYFTDGFYIWPIYYLHYLKKYSNFFIDPNLLNKALDSISGYVNAIDKACLKDIEIVFDNEWSGKYE